MKLLKLLFFLILCIPASAQIQLGADIDGEAAGDDSGFSVSLSSDGTTVAIGAPDNDDNGSNAGHVRIYEYSAGSWTQLGADIDGEAAGDYSGRSVSLSSDGATLAIGAYGNDGNGTDAGHVRIYEYSAGSWTQLGADIDGEAAGDYSGFSVSLSSDGTTVAIGAPDNDDNGNSAGHVRVYSLPQSNLIPDYIPINGLEVYYPLDTLGSSNPSSSGDSSVGRDLGFFNHHWNAGSSYIPKTNRFGVPGGAMSYTQNVAQTPYSGVLGTESRSVSVWVKHKGYSSDPVFFQYGSQVAGKRFSGHVNYNCNGVGVGSAFSTTTNNQALDTNWHHIVYVLDTSQCSGSCSVTDVDVYVDGVMYPNCNVFNGSTAINTIGTFNLQFIFGNNTIADSNRLALDDFGMWNRPLTQGEILDLYSGSSGCIVFDTIPVFDTSFVDVFDTNYVDVFDTNYIDVFDTIYITQIDTLYLTVTDTLIIDVSLIGINPPTFEYQLRVYPNPTNSYLYIEVPQNMIGQSYSMEVRNSIGQSMFGVGLNQPLVQIDFNSFGAAGSYTLLLKNPQGAVIDTRIIMLQ